MARKRFATILNELIGGLDKKATYTVTEIMARAKAVASGKAKVRPDAVRAALQDKSFVKDLVAAYDRSKSGRVILSFKKTSPSAITVEQWIAAQANAKLAQVGLKKYWAEHSRGTKKQASE